MTRVKQKKASNSKSEGHQVSPRVHLIASLTAQKLADNYVLPEIVELLESRPFFYDFIEKCDYPTQFILHSFDGSNYHRKIKRILKEAAEKIINLNPGETT